MKDIVGYEGIYSVSPEGRVWGYERSWRNGDKKSLQRHKGKWLSSSLSGKGYPKVDLRKDGKRVTRHVHRLVAQAFLPNPNQLPQINHRDGDKTNNGLGNLEWCTGSQNIRHFLCYTKAAQGGSC
jgi:hypothetical protein